MIYALFRKVSDEDIALYEKALPLISEKRREKAASIKDKKKRAVSAFAELLLIKGLSYIGIEDADIEYPEGKKPYIKGNKAYISISHSGSFLLCCVSDKEIGCDIQEKGEVSPAAHERLFGGKGDFYLRFVFCESYAKYKGEGIMNTYKELIFGKDDIPQNEGVYFKELSVSQEVRAALCSERKDEIKIIEFDINEIIKGEER